MVVSAVRGVSTCEFCFPTWREAGSFKVAIPNAIPDVWCGTVWNNQTTFRDLPNVSLQTAGITEFGASSSNATGNASSSSHTSDATYATYASMDQPAEQRLASWWSLKSKDKQFSNELHQGSPRIVEV